MKIASPIASALIGIALNLSAFAGPKLPWVHLAPGTSSRGMQLLGDSLYISTDDGFVIVNRKSLATTRLSTATASLPKNRFEAFLVDSKRRIWLSTAEMVYLWEENHWKKVVFPVASLNEYVDIMAFVEDTQGNVWGSNFYGSLIRFGNDAVQVIDSTNSTLLGPSYRLVDPDPAGGLWAKTRTGIARLKDGTWTTIPTSRFAACLDQSTIRRIRADVNGHVWVLTRDRLIEVDADTCHSRYTGLKTRFGNTDNDVYGDDLSIDSKGDKWTGFQDVVVRFSDTAEVYDLTKSPFPGAAPYTISQVKKDSGADAWIYAKTGSVYRLNTASGVVDSIAFGNPQVIYDPRALAADSNGVVWVGSTFGIHRVENGTWTKTWPDTSYNADGPGAWFLDLRVDKRGTLIGVNASGSMVVFQPDGKPRPPFGSLFYGTLLSKSSAGDVWGVGGYPEAKIFHLGYFDGAKWVSLPQEPKCALCVPTEAVFDSTGTIWLASTEGLFRFKDSVWTRIPAGASGPISDVVTSVELDNQGRLWIATDKGLTIYDGQTWKNLTKTDLGGRETRVGFLKRDSKGRIWMGLGSFYTHEGWVGYYFENTLNFLEPSDGLLENTVNFLENGNDGTFYIGSQAGLNTFKESEVSKVVRRIPLILRPVSRRLHDALGRSGQDARGKVFLH